MTALSVAAALALALGTTGAPPCLPFVNGKPRVPADLVLSVALEESGLDPARVNDNANGTRDWGWLQINDSNFDRLGLTPASALDACASMRAAARVLLEAYDGGATDEERLKAVLRALSAYNTGSPSSETGEAYAARVVAAAREKIIPALAQLLPAAAAAAAPEPPPDPSAAPRPPSRNLLPEPTRWRTGSSRP